MILYDVGFCNRPNQYSRLPTTQSNSNTPSHRQTGTIWRRTSSKQALPVHLHQHWAGQHRLLPKHTDSRRVSSPFLNMTVVATQWDFNKHGRLKWKWKPYIKTTNFALSLFRRVYSHWLAHAMYISRSRSRSRTVRHVWIVTLDKPAERIARAPCNLPHAVLLVLMDKPCRSVRRGPLRVSSLRLTGSAVSVRRLSLPACYKCYI